MARQDKGKLEARAARIEEAGRALLARYPGWLGSWVLFHYEHQWKFSASFRREFDAAYDAERATTAYNASDHDLRSIYAVLTPDELNEAARIAAESACGFPVRRVSAWAHDKAEYEYDISVESSAV